VHILAILTPKGERDYDKRPHEAKQTPGEVREQHGRDRLHDPKRSLGEALCDGGDPNWTLAGAARPVLSEARLARLLATPAEQRGEALTRLARMLATRRDRASGVNCVEIAALLLSHDAKSNLQQIARAYYRRLDSALRNAEQEKVQP
jgi:CRISPR system Cascade subunit CasB